MTSHPNQPPGTPGLYVTPQSQPHVQASLQVGSPKLPVWKKKWFVPAVAGVVGLVLGSAVAGGGASGSGEAAPASTVTVSVTETAAPEPAVTVTTTATAQVTVTAEPVVEAALTAEAEPAAGAAGEPATEAAAADVDAPTVSQANAVRKAESYLDFTSFSRSGLIDQLLYEGFTQKQAEYGVKSVGL